MISVDVQLDRGDFALDVAFESAAPLLGVFGPSGAGKTTLINLMAGIERPDRGRVVLDDRTLVDRAGGIDVPTHRRRVGVVFQEQRLFPHYSVRGNLLYGAGGDGSALPSIVDLLELEPLLQRRIGQLSGGERQRVELGRALLSAPDMLLLDEPLASLDHRLRQQILPYLRRIHEVASVPVLYVSHELPEILQLTDELLVLSQGRVAGCGRYTDLVHDADVLSVVHDRGMINMLSARVVAHHVDDGVTTLDLGGAAQLVAPITRTPVGESVMITLQPWDIALAESPVEHVSIQNQIRGTVTRCTTHDRRALVEIDVGAPLIVEISRRSATTMRIEPGKSITCLIKSHAIRCAGEDAFLAPTTER